MLDPRKLKKSAPVGYIMGLEPALEGPQGQSWRHVSSGVNQVVSDCSPEETRWCTGASQMTSQRLNKFIHEEERQTPCALFHPKADPPPSRRWGTTPTPR